MHFKIQSQIHLKVHSGRHFSAVQKWNGKILQKIVKTWPWVTVTLRNIIQTIGWVMSLHHWVRMFGQFQRQYHHCQIRLKIHFEIEFRMLGVLLLPIIKSEYRHIMIQRQKFVWKLTLIFTRSIIWGIASAFSDKLIWKQSLLGSLVKILDKSMTVPFLHSFLAEMLISLLFFGKGSQNLEHPKRGVFLDKMGQKGTGPLLWNSGWIETFPISGWTLFGTQGVNWL